MSTQDEGLRVGGSADRAEVAFTFAGKEVRARVGDTVAMALWAAGERVVHRSSTDGEPRGLYCNMGICYECQVIIDGQWARACMTVVQDGMAVEHGGKR